MMASSGRLLAIALMAMSVAVGAEPAAPAAPAAPAEPAVSPQALQMKAQALKMKEIRELFMKHESEVMKTNNAFQDRLLKLKQDMQTRLGKKLPGKTGAMAQAMGITKPRVLPPFTAGLNELGIGIADAGFNDIFPQAPSSAVPSRAYVYGAATDSPEITAAKLQSSYQGMKDHINQPDER